MDSDADAFARVMGISLVGVLPMALKAAIQLQVPDILAECADDESKGLTALEIASRLRGRTASVNDAASMLDRILRVLASHGLLSASTTVNGISYALNSLSRLLVQSHTAASLSPFVVLTQDPVYWKAYYNFQDAVLHGGTLFLEVHGTTSFKLTQQENNFNQLFNEGMLCHSVLVMSKMLETYRGFEDLHSLVDVGGGVGVCLGMITTKYPHIKGINLDLPHVIEAAPSHLGVQHIGGDMFVEIPKAEAMFMKWILHNWSDDHCLQILKNCHQSLPANGKVIALDALLPDQVENSSEAHATYHMDLVMLAFHIGGKERTKDEIKALAITAGFSKLEVIHNVYGMSIMEISK